MTHAIRLLRLRVTVAEIKCRIRVCEEGQASEEQNVRFFLICESGYYLNIYIYKEIEGPNGRVKTKYFKIFKYPEIGSVFREFDI